MSQALRVESLDALPRAAASDVKRHGWRGVMRLVSEQGKLLITNHSAPEAVVLSAHEYNAMVDALHAARQSAGGPLEALRARFDARLAALDADDAGERMDALFDEPARLHGALEAGTGY